MNTHLLTPTHLQHLKQSAISDEIIAERGYRSISSKAEWATLQPAFALSRKVLRYNGIAFPVHRLSDVSPDHWVLRPDSPRRSSGRDIKYETPTGVPNCFDVLPRYLTALGDPSIPLWFTEGAKKADALATAYDQRITPISLNGVWGYRCTNAKGGKISVPDFSAIAWNGRIVVIAFDSDVIRKPEVMAAVQQLAKLVGARGAASVQILMLPDDPHHKCGVDDFLAEGHTTGNLEAHLTPLWASQATVRTRLCLHPQTGADLYLPRGYTVINQQIARVNSTKTGQDQIIYSGLLFVSGTGANLNSGIATLTVAFNDQHGLRFVTAPRTDLARARGVIDHLGAQNAVVHEVNAREIARYLIESANTNADVLPHQAHLDQLGLNNDALMLPTGGIGFKQPVCYLSHSLPAVGYDRDAYPRAMREALTWPDAPAFLLVIGLSLASPVIARLRLRRNAVIYLSGGTAIGKTTVVHCGTGVWGDPTRRPFLVQGNDVTPVGLSQAIDYLGGLPLFVDEAHATRDPAEIERLVYRFANGEGRLIGGKDGRTRGGNSIGGTLFLAGERMVGFKNIGATRRVLWLDCDQWPPLGAGTIGCSGSAEFAEGQRRAKLLQSTWEAGAAWFGKAVMEVVWHNWSQVERDVRKCAQDPRLQPFGAWADPLAAAFVVLQYAFMVTQLPVVPQQELLEVWARMLPEGYKASDPAIDAWERLVTMMVQAEPESTLSQGWTIKKLGHKSVAYQRSGDIVWRIPTQTQQLKERVGQSRDVNVAREYGQSWVDRGWVIPDNEGKSTHFEAIPGGKVRVLLVPDDKLTNWNP